MLIDDARCVGAEPDYPSLEQIRDCIRQHGGNRHLWVRDDCIRIVPGTDKTLSVLLKKLG